MLPGPTDSWRSYQPVLELLPAWVRAVAVSQRGHGESDKPETGHRVEDFAADVVSLLDALHVERAVLVGHSGSCLVARRVALTHLAGRTGPGALFTTELVAFVQGRRPEVAPRVTRASG